MDVLNRSHTSAITKEVPKDLLIGAASSAYQVEGAWNEYGKGENIWDRMVHTHPENIVGGTTGDVACDAYHKTKEDVALMKTLGLQFYRFSISWSRILPTGFPNRINHAGIKYYHELIDELLAHNIQPMVTMFHWDLPQPLQDLGGWANPEIQHWFKDYARVLFDEFADKVKIWITVNEPNLMCHLGYGSAILAPELKSDGIGTYLCAHHLLKAHAEVYHLYDKLYRPKHKGRIGLTVECAWGEPASNKTEDIIAADRRTQFDFGMYTHAVFLGDYPPVVKEFVAKRSKDEGFPRSRLPEFTPEEAQRIKGTSDFYGLNYYTSLLISDKPWDPIGDPSEKKDMRVEATQDPNWLTGSFHYFKLAPWGLRKLLKFIKDTYGDPEIMITENGFPDHGGFDDQNRIRYFTENIGAMLDAIHEDKVKVTAYTAWCLMDNFEWNNGYKVKFGLYHVDFDDDNRPRTPKASAKFYKNLISTRKLVVNGSS